MAHKKEKKWRRSSYCPHCQMHFCNGCVRLPDSDLLIISLSVKDFCSIILIFIWPYAVAMEMAAVQHFPTVTKT